MIMRQSDINRVRESVGKQLGNKVMVALDRGRHRVDVTEGVIKEAYPNVFIIEVEGENSSDIPQVLSFSYTDVLTKEVRMKLC